MTWHAWARARRRELRLSQAELARRANVALPTVGRAERGESVLPMTRRDIERVLGAPPATLEPQPMSGYAQQLECHAAIGDLVATHDGDGRPLSLVERIRLLVEDYEEFEAFLADVLDEASP